MEKTNLFSQLSIMFKLDLMLWKNKIKDIFSHPIKAIGAIFKVLLPFIIACWPLILSITKPKAKKSITLPMDIVGAALMAVILLIIFRSLYKAIEKYSPAEFTMADVSFLFTAPLNSRAIYFWAFLKSVWKALLAGIFMLFPPLMFLMVLNMKFDTSRILAVILGFALINIFTKSLDFFIYSISKKYKVGKAIEIIIYAMIGGTLCYFLVNLLNSTDKLAATLKILGGATFEKLPVVGWFKAIYISILPGTADPMVPLVKMFLLTVIIVAIAVYFATDYYEEALSSTEKITAITKASKTSNYQELESLAEKKKIKTFKVSTSWTLKGAFAFAWKDYIIKFRRSKGFKGLLFKYILYAAVGVGVGSAAKKNDYAEVVLLVGIFAFFFTTAILPYLGGLEFELKKSYVYLLPGRVREKILGINLLPTIELLTRNIFICVPIAILTRISIVQALMLWLYISVFQMVKLYTIIVIKVVMPFEDMKNIILVYLRMIIEALVFVPSAGLAVLFWYLTKNIEASLLVFSILGVGSIYLLLVISEKIFKNIELK